MFACFLCSCFFYGVGFNLIFALCALLGPLGVLVSLRVERVALTISAQPGFVLACLGALLLIMAHHLFGSISPDTSFAPAIILGALPLWALTVWLLPERGLLYRAIFLLVFVFAAISAVDYLFAGTRAHAPLWDPNNYVTLLYLVWIPWALLSVRDYEGAGTGLRILAGTALFCIALLATHSRFAMLVIAGMGVLGVLASWRFRLPWQGAAWLLAGIAVAVLTYAAGAASEAPAGGSLQIAVESSAESERWQMLQAAFDGIQRVGGLSGSGLYTFTLLYPMLRSLGEQGTTGEFVHNDYVQLMLEGGIWLTLPMLLLCAVLALTFLRRVAAGQELDVRLAFVVAMGCAAVHALVNFVFYVLPLTILFGVLLGGAFAPHHQVASEPAGSAGRTHLGDGWVRLGKWLAIALLLVNSALLALDALTYGVFAGQLHVPGASALRANPERMQRFAGFAQSINGRRGVPVLAQAQLHEARLASGSTPLALAQARLTYQRAIEVDPWNPMAFTRFARFLERYPAAAEGVDRGDLLYQALALNPARVETNAMLLTYHRKLAEGQAVLGVASNIIAWCETMRRTDMQAADHLLETVLEIGVMADDSQMTQQVESCRLLDVSADSAGRTPTWMMRWLRSQRPGGE